MSKSDEFPKRYNFKEIEARCTKKWKEEGTYKFELSPDDKHEDIFSIDTPPPFTSGQLHMGHILNHSWIDFMARFRRLQGKKVYLPQGFDCHGLPTELKVQNGLGIDKNNRDEFLQACKDWTEDCIVQMKDQFDSLGYSTDWSYSYKTMEESYVRMVQQSLLEFFKKGWLYRAKHPVHWCPKCETSLAKQEVGYIEMEGKIYEIKLPIHDRPGEYVTIATTRPEMMEACICVLVHPKDYRYQDLSAAQIDIPFANRTVPMFMDNAVDPNFGTGVVYCCTYGDEQDLAWKIKYDLPEYQVITPDGKMAEWSHFAGMTTKEAQKAIAKELDEMGLLVSEKSFPHRVIVHTERSSCLSPIEYLPVPQWFIKVKDFTQEIKESGLSLDWHPDLSRRLIDWCDNLTWDWVVSRQRVFGTPIPFWYCSNHECDYVIPAEEQQLPLDPMKNKPPIDKCPKCGSPIIGEKDVCDCWVDSSITPLRISQWKLNDEFFNTVYPITNRPQGYEIIRTWLFYTLFRSKKLTGKTPFSEIMINGMVAGPDGRKMSKSFGNTVSPDEVFPYYGSDTVRQWAALGTLGEDYPFNFHWVMKKNPKQKVKLDKIKNEMKRVATGKMTQKEFDEKYRKDSEQLKANTKFLTKMWNAYRLVWMQTKDIDIKNIDEKAVLESQMTPIDNYILSLFNTLSKEIHEHWNVYKWRDGYTKFRSYFWNVVCDQYLESLKYRFNSKDNQVKKDAIVITLSLFSRMLKIISVIVPFISEELYLRIFKKWEGIDSIHLSRWPETFSKIDENIAKIGKIQIEATALLRNAKSKAKIALNKPVKKAAIILKDEEKKILNDNIEPIVQTLRIESLDVIMENEFDDSKLPENAIHLHDEFTNIHAIIYKEE